MTVNTNINFPQGPFLDAQSGRPALQWLLWLQNPSVVGITTSTPLGVISGGTDNNITPEDGELLIGKGGKGYAVNFLTAGSGISIANGPGTITISAGNAGIPAGTYGSATTVPQLTFNTAGALTNVNNVTISVSASTITGGILPSAVVVGSYTGITGVGTLTAGVWNATPIAVLYGGTGATTASGARTNLSAASSGANSDITSLTGLTTALDIPYGGTNATTASGARTNLGLGSGLSVTITTAKLTGGGANGSMTFTNGILTAQTAAT